MDNASVDIKMDYREKDSGIAEILRQKYGIAVAVGSLEAGDYIVNNEIVVERKTTLDFAQSIIDGRLFKQAERMRSFFDFSLVIIEGNDFYDTSVDIHPHAIKGAMVSMALRWGIPILFSAHAQDSACFLRLLGTQDVKVRCGLSYRSGRRPKRICKRQIYILQGLPGVGPVLAAELLDHFGSVESVMTAQESELSQIPRLGKIKAKKIRDILSKIYA